MSDHGPRNLAITPSRFQWDKFKDLLHYFVMIGLIPITAIVFYANVFIGPAKLTTIPEGYVPKHWEYHRVSGIKNDRGIETKISFIRSFDSIQFHVSYPDTCMHHLNRSMKNTCILWQKRKNV